MKDAGLSSKDKKYKQQLQKILLHFETVEEWPDYISFLNKLQKTIQSNISSTKHWIPQDLEISMILSKCLSPNLPSGVHQKTLEIYQLIFKELGIDTLSFKVNVWMPGILPIMQFASISIKPLVIQLYKDFLLTMPSHVLKPLIKPILSYLFCSIDDERSEFFETSLDLIDKFRSELNDDSLFWQSVFLLIITSEEKRLGALVWCNKRLPHLNVVIEESKEKGYDYKKELYKKLTLEQQALINPEPGLLIRAFIASLNSDNLLIQRGFFDVLIKNFQLNSDVLQRLTKPSDLQYLIISVTNTILKKDMSLNRRVWNWLLGPEDIQTTTGSQEKYFQNNGFELLSDALLKLVNGEYYHESSKTVFEQKVSSFKICLAIMDKWEIGSLIIPRVVLPALKSIRDSVEKKVNQWEEILKRGSVLFDAIETITIFQNLFKELNEDGDEEFLCFILQNFNFNDEEMMIHQLPLLLITTLIKNSKAKTSFKLMKLLLDLIPQRALLPIEHAVIVDDELKEEDILKKIENYYNENDDVMNLPFQPANLSLLLLRLVTKLVADHIDEDNDYQYLEILNTIVDIIPLLEFKDESFLNILHNVTFEKTQKIVQISRLFVKYRFETPFVQLQVLQKIINQLLSVLLNQKSKYQIEVVKVIQSLTFDINSHYIEAAISSYLLSLSNFSKRLGIFNYLWIHSTDDKFLNRPLYIILDELNNQEDSNSVVKTTLNNWVLNCSHNGFGGRLFQILTLKLYESLGDFELFKYHALLLYKILDINQHLQRLFSEELVIINSVELKDLNGFTYKVFTLWALSNFFTKNTECFDSDVLNAIFKLTERLFNGEDGSKLFDSHYFKVFEISSQFILHHTNYHDFDLVSIVLVGHLTKLIKISIENTKSSSDSVLLIKNNSKSSLIEFLLSIFDKFNTPQLLETLMNLLNTLLKFQDKIIFQYIESIALNILRKIDELYNRSVSKEDVSISLLLTHLKEILFLLRTYVINLEVNDPPSYTSENPGNSGFFTSVVSNVFNPDSGKKECGSESAAAENRRVMMNCFDKTTYTCFKIWLDSDLILKNNGESQDNEGNSLSLKYQAMKLRHKSKALLRSLYEIEPTEVLKSLILNNEKDAVVFKLLHVLDNTRPQLTILYIFKLFKLNQNSTSRPTLLEVSEFLNDYTLSLQDDSMEDIFQDSISFLRELASEISTYPKTIAFRILKLITIIAEKLGHSKFGEQKKVKKEINDIFLKLLPIALNSKNNQDISLALSATIGRKDETLGDDVLTSSQQLEPATNFTNEEESIHVIRFIVPRIKYIMTDIDKQGTVVSTISINFLAPNFIKTSKSFPYEIQSYQLELLNDLVINYPSVKSLKLLISEAFHDSKFFKIKLYQLLQWNSIIKHWLGYHEAIVNSPNETSGEKISDLLVKSTQSTSAAVNIFNWNENEQNVARLLNLRRIGYLLLISDKDRHIVVLQEIFAKLDELLSGQSIHGSDELSSLLNLEVFTILRVVVLKFSSIHLYDYWTFIYTSLQRFFLKLLDASENELESLSLPSVLAACKLLDLLLVLKFEDFQEWIFIIDTANAIFKNYDIISLIDTISSKDELFKNNTHSEKTKSLLTNLPDFRGIKKPALLGVRKVDSLTSLKPYFDGLSYYNYENVYNGISIDYDSCLEDVYSDIFDATIEK